MLKKVLYLLAILLLVVSLATAALSKTSYKIGIATGTVSQNEDEYRGAEAAIKKYPDLFKHVTYPDNFM